jgi:hypothetical protein
MLPQGIFISYRRADSAPYARLLQVELSKRFPDVPIFMDLDSIEPGLDFAAIIRDAVNSCRVMVVLIGRQWTTLADDEGRRRLDDPDDYVRFEIRTALKRGVRTIPVLLDGARMPRQEHLPHDLRKLARLHALDMGYDHYPYDAGRLTDIIERALATETGSADADNVAAPLDAPGELEGLSRPTKSAKLARVWRRGSRRDGRSRAGRAAAEEPDSTSSSALTLWKVPAPAARYSDCRKPADTPGRRASRDR